MEDDVRYACNGDVTLAYRVTGEGPVDLVWTNIWYSHLELIEAHPQVAGIGQSLASFAKVLTWDRRGAGLSDRLPGPATLEEGVDDLLAVMDDAGMERATLFGFNESSMLCALAAATHPDRFSSLVIYGGFATTTRQDDYPWGQDPEERALQVQYLCANWGTREVAQMMLMTEDETLIDWGVRWQRNSVSRDALPAFYDMLGRTDVRQVLPSIQVPTLILHRKDDQAITPDNGRYLADRIPASRYVELDGFQHAPFMGDWEALVDEIEEFTTGHRRARETDRVLATILFTDIVDSTEKAASLGDETWKQLLDMHDRLCEDEIRRFNGRLVKTTGDGVLATFDGPQRAIRCARAIVNSVRRLGLEIRAGLHTGEVEMRGNDVGGIAVHIGARVMDLAGPNQVLASGAVPPLVAGSGIGFVPRGTRELKGIDGEWSLFEIAV